MDISPDFWRKCSTCKKPIPYLARYHVCTVSTCNKKRGGYIFCSVPCWDVHVPMMNHRNAWSEERRSPSKAEWAAENAEPQAAPVASSPPAARATAPVGTRAPSSDEAADKSSDDILVVASKLKDYIRARSGMNTSASVLDTLSDRIRVLADGAIENARIEGRKTVLDRDIPEI